MSLKSLAIACCLIFTFLVASGRDAPDSKLPKSDQQPDTEATRTVELPDTQLGSLAKSWLAAVNSGQPEEVKRFVEGNFSANAFRYQLSAEKYIALFNKLYEQSGGLELVKVTPPVGVQPLSLIARSRRSDRYVRITMGLDGNEANKLAGLGVDRSQSPDTPTLSAAYPQLLSEKEMIAAIRERLEKRAADGEFSGVVLVAHHDKILLESSYGFADREAKIPNTLETRFHLASAGKMFTAVAIAQLVSKGKLSYTDTVAKILPDYPNREVAEKVTVHQLLTHSAGLGTFFESPGFVPGRKYSNATEEMAVYKDEKLFFEPGTRWRYSNAGFSLLGAIIERLSGKTYLEYVRENIFRPLKMKDTYSNVNGETDPHTSVFYTQSPTDPLGVEPYVPNRGLGASQGSGFGGGFSTAGDLFKFVRALRTNRLLGEKLTQQMISSAVNQDERGTRRSGYGIVESVLNGETIRGHSGGSRTDVEMLWNSDYTVIAQSNAFPLSVNVLSNEIIDFITTQNALRNKK